MKKLFTLLFAAVLVTAASAQQGDRHQNDSRGNNNSYQSSPYSNNDRNGNSNQYADRDRDSRNSQWNGREDHDRFDRDRKRAEQERYEMAMRRNQAQYHNERSHDSRSQLVVRLPLFGLLSEIFR